MSGEASGNPAPSVLLVEDNVDHARLAKRALDDDFHVTHVRTGAEALETAGHREFDVALIDQRLPDRGGIELCRQLRGDGHEGLIFLVTGASRDALAQRAFDAGADDFLVKGPRFVDRIKDDMRAHLEVEA